LRINEFDFDQVILPLGKTLPEGRAAALAVFDAMVDMAWRAEAAVMAVESRKEADSLTIALHADAMSVCEENVEQVCAALMTASALSARPHDESSFWVEVSVPHVFSESDSTMEQSFSVDRAEAPAGGDDPPPDWFTDALWMVNRDRGALRFEDFTPNTEQMAKLADMHAAVKALAESTGAAFEFTKPEPPRNLHGGVHLKARGSIRMEDENLAALIAVFKASKSFGVSNTDDGYVYLSFWVNNIYVEKE